MHVVKVELEIESFAEFIINFMYMLFLYDENIVTIDVCSVACWRTDVAS